MLTGIKRGPLNIRASLIAIVVVVVVTLFNPLYISAEAPPGTDNVTNVNLYPSDNLTVILSATDLEAAITTAATAHAGALSNAWEDLLGTIFGILFVLMFNIFAFWHRERVLYIIAGFCTLLYGFQYVSSDQAYISWLLGIFGVFTITVKGFFDRKK